jgi:hypothetical protein
VQPADESVRIAKPPQLAPGDHQCLLRGVLGPIDVSEDPLRDREEPIAVGARENAEGFPVAPLRLLHEVAIHLHHPRVASSGDAVPRI